MDVEIWSDTATTEVVLLGLSVLLCGIVGLELLRGYGAFALDVARLVADDPTLGDALEGAPRYLRAEVVYAVTHEGALHVDDVMLRRTRIALEYPDHGEASATEVAGLMALLLGWNADETRAELDDYRHAVGVHDAGADNTTPR